MKFLFLFFLAFAFQGHAQLLSGQLLDDKRELLSNSTFAIDGSTKGSIVFDLSVDITGNVTSSKLLSDKTTVISTPARMKAKELASNLKFEPGTHFPKFHHVIVQVNVNTVTK